LPVLDAPKPFSEEGRESQGGKPTHCIVNAAADETETESPADRGGHVGDERFGHRRFGGFGDDERIGGRVRACCAALGLE
jgi:hypothetical protein